MVLIGCKASEADEGWSDIPLSPWPWVSSSLVTFDLTTPTTGLRNPALWTVHGGKASPCLQMRIDFPHPGCWKCRLKYVNNVSQEQFFHRIVDAEMNWLFFFFFVEEGSGAALYKSTWREFLDANRLAILIARLKCTHTLWRALRFRYRAQGGREHHHCPNGNCFRSSLVHPWFTGFSWWMADTKYFGKKNVSQRNFFPSVPFAFSSHPLQEHRWRMPSGELH